MKIKINHTFIRYFILLMIVVQPKIFTQYKISSIIYAAMNILVFVYLLLIKKVSISKKDYPILLWIALRVFLLFNMMRNSYLSDIDQWGYLSIMVVNMYLIVKMSVNKGEIKDFIKSGNSLLNMYLIINLLSMLTYSNGIIPSTNLFDNGDGDFYFLGIKVAFTTYVFVTLLFGYLNLKVNDKKIGFALSLLLSLITIIYANISTGIVCMSIILLMIIIKKILYHMLNAKFIIFSSIGVNAAVIFLGFQNRFSYLITEILHKTMSLTGRTNIWVKALSEINSRGFFNKILGNGIFNNGSFVNMSGTYWPAHNMWIQYMFEYGLIGIILFCIMIIVCDKKNKSDISYFLLAILFSIFIGTITMNYFSYSHVYLIIIALFFSKEIEEMACNRGKYE